MPKRTTTATKTKKASTPKAAKPNPAPVKATTKPTTTPVTPDVSGVIKLLKPNPHREGTKDNARFAALKDGLTVEAALKGSADVRRIDLNFWLKHGAIEIVR